MKKKKIQNFALEKATISSLQDEYIKPFPLQRLMHDYNEINNQEFPLPGVSAVPLENDFYEWHGNVKALSENAYSGAILHFKLTFPKNYPIEPPKIYLLNNGLKHPNILSDRRICLDILEKINDKKDTIKGWKSGYTILSILLELQSFFFEVDENYLTYDKIIQIEHSVKIINEYKCSVCGHEGSNKPYPEFPEVNEKDIKLNKEQYKNAKLNEICCYYRKMNFKEGPLGLGISISKILRTGEIREIKPCFDFISLTAFRKDRLRKGLNGDKFTHWFPLFFGEKKEEFLNSVTKAISMIVKGNTKEFKTNLILKVMPKFLNYICLNIISEDIHNSSRVFNILIYIYRILIMFVQEFPEFKSEINKNLEQFINEPKCRIKEITPSLGDLLVMLSVSDYKMEELLPSYISEQMDRQIFWILQEIPEFEILINSSKVDDIRAKVCFKCGIVGQQLLLFYYYFIKNIVYYKFAQKLDQNYCTLTEKEIDQHRKEINKILKIDNYNDFYKFMGMKPPSKDELNNKLKQAFINSKIKKYHGIDEVRYVPLNYKQVEYYIMNRYEPIDNLIQKGKLLPAENPKWKQLVNNLDIVKEYKYYNCNQDINPLEVIKFYRKKYNEILLFDINSNEEKPDYNRIGKEINQKKFYKKEEDEEILKELNYRQLYIKFYFEDYCKYFIYIKNFKELYKLLDLFKEDIFHFVLFIPEKGPLKNDFNYIRAILSKLSSIKYLELIFTKGASIKLIKNLIKGISNSLKNKSEIKHLKIIINPKYNYDNTKDLNILKILDNMPALKVLDLSDVSLNLDCILCIKNHLYIHKKLSVLDLSYCNLNDEMCNELADGIMKAKSLEKIYLNGNKIKKGLSTILYNLAFQPSIKIIDISDNKSIYLEETSNSLNKLIKLSQTIEKIIANKIDGLNKALTNDFYIALGDNSNLNYLGLSKNGRFSDINSLGMAISFNALKKGSLSYIDISNNKLNFDDLRNLIKGMYISEEDHNSWYGFHFNSYIHKETPEYYSKYFHCNLEKFIFNGNDLCSDINYSDPLNSDKENILKTFLSKSKKLDTLVLNKNKYNKNFFDSFAEGLKCENNLKFLSLSKSNIDNEIFKSFFSTFYLNIPQNFKKVIINENNIENNNNPNFHIEILDLSNNKLGYNGIENLCNALKINNTIKKINLFGNLFGVGGARLFADVFKNNNNLVELDIGFNRIKNIGFKSIIKSIEENKINNLKFLGVKYNFIDNKTFEEQINIIEQNKNIAIEEIEIKDNNISPAFLMNFWNEKYIKMQKSLKIDIFEILANIIPEKLERTVWVSTGNNPKLFDIMKEIERRDLNCFVEEDSKLGIPLAIRKLKAKQDEKKKKKGIIFKNIYIEFMMPSSVNRMIKLGSTSKFILNGKNCKIYKAGTKPEDLNVKVKDYSNLPKLQPKIQLLKAKNKIISKEIKVPNEIKKLITKEIKPIPIPTEKQKLITKEIKAIPIPNEIKKIKAKEIKEIPNEIKKIKISNEIRDISKEKKSDVTNEIKLPKDSIKKEIKETKEIKYSNEIYILFVIIIIGIMAYIYSKYNMNNNILS